MFHRLISFFRAFLEKKVAFFSFFDRRLSSFGELSTVYPQSGQPFENSSGVPVFPH